MSIGPSSSPPDLVKYELLDEIGHGGMATVYRARDVRLEREVAVKLMHPHLRDNQEAAARFVAEARAVAQLRHQGIVEIYDVSDEEDDERFLVAQLVRGPSLRTVIDEHPELPPEVGACFGLLLCDALGHAHDKGIIHRDVKPENVLMELVASRKAANVKLTDFGIAKVVDAQGVTSTGQVLGSPAHMAPEQIDGGEVDARSDVFSLGVLVYECMVGHLPFEGKNPAQLLRRVLEGDYPAPDRERPKVGSRWAAILAMAIARDPEERCADVRELAAALRQELEKVGIEDPCEEIYAYLDAPKEYVEAFEPKLVGILTRRADAARQNRDVKGAAADLNRAVAYAPDDEALLQRLTSLASGQRRRDALAKAFRVAVGVMVLSLLGGGGYLSVKWLRPEPAKLDPAEPVPIAEPSVTTTMTLSVPIPSVRLSTSAAPTRSRPLKIPPIPSGLRPVRSDRPSDAVREVSIKAHPGAALVSVDGAPAVPVGFELRRTLPVGMHTFTFSTPKGNPCCKPRTFEVEVKEGEGVQSIAGGVYYRDAILSLVGGSEDATLECPAIGKTIRKGETASVHMVQIEHFVKCTISGSGIPPRQMSITLRAGEPEPIVAR